ncbi:MAG: cell division protein FtsH, partial [Chloroflexia bacterium]|nr:cell division protein FtsH [Chloroflexia bacterium]
MADQKWLRNGAVWIILIVALIALWFTFVSGDGAMRKLDFSPDVIADINAGQVERLIVQSGSSDVRVVYTQESDQRDATTVLPPDTNVPETLTAYGIDPRDVAVEVKPASRWGNWIGGLTFLIPMLFLVGIFIFMMRQTQGSNNQAMSFGKSRARLFTGNRPSVTFADVAGVD